jgi:hypothetical protein
LKSSAPFFELAVALVAGIGEGLEEFAIAPRTTDVLGGLWPLASIIAGIKHARFGIDRQIVAESYAPGAVVSEVARRHEISRLSAWRRAARQGLLKLPHGTGPMVMR